MSFINTENKYINNGIRFFNLGNIYYYGLDVEKNFKKAFGLYLKASTFNIAEAFNMLGVLSFNGEGVNKNLEDSVYYFEKAKDLGNLTAMFNLALIYVFSEDKKDYCKAHAYLEKLVDLGYILAKDVLDYLYYNGYGENKDYNKALNYWINNDILDFSNINMNNDINIPYTIEDFGNFEELVIENSNFSDDIEDKRLIDADNYYNGTLGKIDYTKAFDIYLKLAEGGNGYAQIKVANMYKDGLGIEKYYTKSLKWYSKALSNSNK